MPPVIVVPRPAGITILAALVIVASFVIGLIGIAGVLVGLAALIPGSGISASSLLVGGILFVILAFVLLVAGAGLLKLRRWAWWLATLATLGGLAYTAYGIANGAGMTVGAIAGAAILGLILVYLLIVYRSFGRPPAVPA